jgi:hypothetical protein
MWNIFYRITGTISFCEGWQRAKFFESISADSFGKYFMSWPNGSVWLRVPGHERGLPPDKPWSWVPTERLPRRRRKVSREEAHRVSEARLSPRVAEIEDRLST